MAKKTTQTRKRAAKSVSPINRPEGHVLSILVDNSPGVLARVIGLFSARGYNIESLTVGTVYAKSSLSRITIITSGSDVVIEQIEAQLGRLVPVHSVANLTKVGPVVGRDLALVKVVGKGEKRVEALRIADVFRARVVDSTASSFIFEITGGRKKVEAFIELMHDLGAVEATRTGIAALARGEASF